MLKFRKCIITFGLCFEIWIIKAVIRYKFRNSFVRRFSGEFWGGGCEPSWQVFVVEPSECLLLAAFVRAVLTKVIVLLNLLFLFEQRCIVVGSSYFA